VEFSCGSFCCGGADFDIFSFVIESGYRLCARHLDSFCIGDGGIVIEVPRLLRRPFI